MSDANIWIDLSVGGLLEAAFRLPLEWLAVDLLQEDLETPSVADLVLRGLRLRELSGDQLLQVRRLSEVHRRPSRNDLGALILAQSLGAPLLTGDQSLRRVAELLGDEVHGTLCLLSRLMETRLVPPQEAADALERMIRAGRRLPNAEVHQRLRAWRDSE